MVEEALNSQNFFILAAAVVKAFAQRPVHGLVGAYKTSGQLASQGGLASATGFTGLTVLTGLIWLVTELGLVELGQDTGSDRVRATVWCPPRTWCCH